MSPAPKSLPLYLPAPLPEDTRSCNTSPQDTTQDKSSLPSNTPPHDTASPCHTVDKYSPSNTPPHDNEEESSPCHTDTAFTAFTSATAQLPPQPHHSKLFQCKCCNERNQLVHKLKKDLDKEKFRTFCYYQKWKTEQNRMKKTEEDCRDRIKHVRHFWVDKIYRETIRSGRMVKLAMQSKRN